MKIPRYWAKGTARGMNEDGEEFSFSSWGWSEKSEAEAKALGQARAEQALSRFLAGERLNSYSYSDRPLREEILQVISDRHKKELALVTRNSYGVLVLNTRNAMFLDIDFEPQALAGCLTGWFQGLRGKKRNDPEAQTLAQVQAWAEKRSELGLRVYRTFAGLRCLVTNQTFDPTHSETEQIMRELNCDPLYIRLCQKQECFRARLTPKPWRCNLDKPPARYPFDTSELEIKFREWEEKYRAVILNFSVCRFLARLGSSTIHPEVEPILKLHDQFCCRDETLALA